MVEGKVVNQWLQCNMQEYCCHFLKVGDESMSETRFWTTEKGNLTHLSYIFRKPEPLGIDFKTVSFYVTGALISIEF